MSSVFDERSEPPDDAALGKALGRSKAHWDAIMRHVEGIDGVSVEWKFYGKKHGWQVKALRKRKALIYLIPHQGSFFSPAWRSVSRHGRPCARARYHRPSSTRSQRRSLRPRGILLASRSRPRRRPSWCGVC
jgi:hypothetical protein